MPGLSSSARLSQINERLARKYQIPSEFSGLEKHLPTPLPDAKSLYRDGNKAREELYKQAEEAQKSAERKIAQAARADAATKNMKGLEGKARDVTQRMKSVPQQPGTLSAQYGKSKEVEGSAASAGSEAKGEQKANGKVDPANFSDSKGGKRQPLLAGSRQDGKAFTPEEAALLDGRSDPSKDKKAGTLEEKKGAVNEEVISGFMKDLENQLAGAGGGTEGKQLPGKTGAVDEKPAPTELRSPASESAWTPSQTTMVSNDFKPMSDRELLAQVGGLPERDDSADIFQRVKAQYRKRIEALAR